MNIKNVFISLPPFIILGVALVLMALVLVLFFWVAIWGIVIGAILWLIALAKDYFLKRQSVKKNGRIIDYNDDK